MSFLLFLVVALHLLLLLLLFIATLDKAWWVLPDGETLNLWYDCVPHNQTHGWVCTSVGDSRLSALGGAGLYAACGPPAGGGTFGHCFALAWATVPLAVASAATYAHLRKRD